jgi:hypothetical protein
MAKKSKVAEIIEGSDGQEVISPAITAAVVKAPRVKKEKVAPVAKVTKSIAYLLGREVTEEDKLNSQCSVIYSHISMICGEFGMCDRQALVNSITIEELKTRQEVSRVIFYYIPLLIKNGLITKEIVTS